MTPLLKVDNLHVRFADTHAVKGISFCLQPGEIVALVGESGSGKTAIGQSIIRLHNATLSGEIWFEGEDLLSFSEHRMQTVRGSRIGMIFQDPMSSLNPTMRVGKQIAETLRLHRSMNRVQARQASLDLLYAVGITQPEQRIDQYPHEYSGGMRQRAMIAMSLACQPALLIADEPTTALDVTIQAQILKLLKQLNSTLGTAILLITHDLGIVASIADRVMVMHQGEIVEAASVDELFYRPQHLYTQSLLAAVRRQN